jgi:transposase
MSSQATPCVGIDVSKKHLDVHSLPDNRSLRVLNSRDGIRELLGQLPTAGSCRVIAEATGGYQRLLVAELVSAGHHVSVVNPRQVRDFARADNRLAKTDKIDARTLARFGQVFELRTVEKTSESQSELQALVAHRRNLIEVRTAQQNRLDTQTSKAVVKSLREMLTLLGTQIALAEEAINRLVEQDDDWKSRTQILKSVPGVGPTTAVSLMADLPELGKLDRQAIGALAGLAPFNRDSGQFKGKRSIWGGRASVRTSLYMATLTARRINPVIRAFAARLESVGKPFKVMMTACMRKLLVILNTMVKTNTTWNPKLVPQKP